MVHVDGCRPVQAVTPNARGRSRSSRSAARSRRRAGSPRRVRGRHVADPKCALAPEAPVDLASWQDDAGHLSPEMLFWRGLPRHELEHEPVVDHRAPSELHALAIDTGDMLARRVNGRENRVRTKRSESITLLGGRSRSRHSLARPIAYTELDATSESSVSAASLPRALAANGLAPVSNLRSLRVDASGSLFAIVTPIAVSLAPNCQVS